MPNIARMDANYAHARALHLNAAIGRLPCPDCGTVDGMAEWNRKQVATLTLLDRLEMPFYRHHARNDVIYVPCEQCNEDMFVPDGFVELMPQQVQGWLQAQAEKEV